ncbi:MAG: extracellular solute-binding protein [Spirochaetaceae bacterium]|nr:extracellular solute-binding protein [Spirochaetaceae bacterium]
MWLKKRKYLIYILSGIIFAGIACLVVSFPGNREETITVWTNNVHIVSYGEVFNSENPKSKIIVQYKEDVADSLLTPGGSSLPDIAIAPWIKSSDVRKKFQPWGSIFNSQNFREDSFYPQLLNLGKIDGRQFFLPVSFNMPLIAYKKGDIHYDSTMDIDDIREMSKNPEETSKAPHMAFGPTWSGDFLYNIAKLHGANFAEDDKSLSYDEDSVARTVEFIKRWSKEINDSVAKEDDFKFKYFFTNAETLLLENRVRFLYERSDTLLPTISEVSRNSDKSQVPQIGFSWIGSDDKTVICDDTVFAGILKNTKNKSLCKKFIKWLLNNETQKKLLARQSDFNLFDNNFGFAGGFSSLPEVNRKVLTVFFPIILDRLPEVSKLYEPFILPHNWDDIKSEVIIPYLEDSVRENTGKSIETRYQEFLANH